MKNAKGHHGAERTDEIDQQSGPRSRQSGDLHRKADNDHARDQEQNLRAQTPIGFFGTDDPQQDQDDCPSEGRGGDRCDPQGRATMTPTRRPSDRRSPDVEGPIHGEQVDVPHIAIAGLLMRPVDIGVRTGLPEEEPPADQEEIEAAHGRDDQGDGGDLEHTEHRLTARPAR